MSEQHHECGPSTLGRLMECPASLALSRDEPDSESEEAREGTLLHDAIRKLIEKDPDHAKGLSEEQRDAVERCYDFADQILPITREGWYFQYWIEKRVELRDGGLGIINFGTADLIAVTDEKIVVIDWKFGRKIKEDSLVLQVSNYAAAAIQTIPELRESTLPIEAWVFFPRLGVRLVWNATSGAEAVNAVVLSVCAVINTAKNANGIDAVPGAWCDYCKHLPNCEAVRQAAQLEIAPATTDDLVDPRNALRLYDLSLIVEKQAKAVREKIRDLLLSRPNAIPGLQLKKRGGKRNIVDAAEIKSRMIAQDKLSVLEYMRACSPTVVALEAAYVKKFYEGRGDGKVTKGELKRRFAAIAGETVMKSESKVLTRT